MQLTVFRLVPRGAFHFGDQGIDLESVMETCPSDTLYAALFWQAYQQGQTWTLAQPKPIPPFRVSSCFPYVNDIQLLPVPMLPPPQNDRDQRPGERKKFKNIRFVSLDIFRHLLKGGSLRDYLGEQGCLLQAGKVLVSATELAKSAWNPDALIWKEEAISHVAVDRATNATQYYETGQIRFNQGCGMSVLASGDTNQLKRLLVDLGHVGLGGRRSKGLGQFEVVEGTSIELPSNTNSRQVLLSRYLPQQSEVEYLAHNQSAYGLEQVTGWLYAPYVKAQRRKHIWMLTAGSVIHSDTKLDGDIANVSPTYNDTPQIHPIWRHGLALTVGVPPQEDA